MSQDALPTDATPTWFDRNTPTFAARYRISRTYRWLTWTLIVLLPVAVSLHVYQIVQKQRYDPRRQPSDAVTVLVTERCPFSRELETALREAGISYRRVDVEKDAGGEWAFQAVHARGVPVTVVGGEVVYGLRTSQLRSTLQKAGRNGAALRFRRETDAPMSTPMKP